MISVKGKLKKNKVELCPSLNGMASVFSVLNSHLTHLQECQRLCRKMTKFECLSYDYAHTGVGVCRMSHHTIRYKDCV